MRPEPAYPDAALADCPTDLRSDPCPAEDAERGWLDEVLIWGREGWLQIGRLCRWDRGHGGPVDCPAPPAGDAP